MIKSTRTTIAWTAAAAALLAAQVGSASRAEARCHGNICLITDRSSTAGTIHFRLVAHAFPVTQFNMIFRGVQSEIKANLSGNGYNSDIQSLPRTTDKVSVQVCNLGALAVTSSCGPWQAFTLPGAWIAIAIGNGHYGVSLGRHSKSEAESHALAACPGGGCAIANVATGSCVAYSRSKTDRTVGGTGIAHDLGTAERGAQNACSAQAPGTCKIRKAKCVE